MIWGRFNVRRYFVTALEELITVILLLTLTRMHLFLTVNIISPIKFFFQFHDHGFNTICLTDL